MDAHKNFAYSTVATAPSPPTSGTSLTVATGDGAKFPTPPFNATIWPAGQQPATSNAEIVRVTAKTTDTLTITRAQEGSVARSVVVGDQIIAGVTAKALQDIEQGMSSTQSPAFAASFTPDASAGEQIFVGALTAAITINAPTNPVLGQRLTFQFVQDATGGRTVTWNAVFARVSWSNTGNTANTRSSISFVYDGTNWLQVDAQKGWS